MNEAEKKILLDAIDDAFGQGVGKAFDVMVDSIVPAWTSPEGGQKVQEAILRFHSAVRLYRFAREQAIVKVNEEIP